MTGVRAAGGPRVAGALRAPGVRGRVRPWSALLMLLVGGMMVLVPASPAAAHAALVAAIPAPGTIIGTSPTEVTVTFSEPVNAVDGRIQVLAPNGRRISGTPFVRGQILHIPVRRADQPLGTYLVSYRIISADSHPVAGGLTFSVGAPSVRAPTAPTDDVHRSVAVTLPMARYLGYAGLTLAVGPALFLALLWPRRRSRRGPVRLVLTGFALIGGSTLAAIWLQAPYRSGGALWQVSAGELRDVLASQFGAVLTARLALLGVLAALLPPLLRGRGGRRRGAVVLALAGAGLTTWPLTGHAAAVALRPLVIVADVVHIAATAVWLGGLITLVAFLLRGTDRRVLAVILPAWSRWATLAVVWLVAGGAVQAVIQVGSPGALWGTGYGRLLIGKIAILAVVLGAAAYARRLVGSTAAGGPQGLRRTVGIEVVATAVVLALSAVLVQTSPARQRDAQRISAAPSGVSQTLTCPLYTLQFNIYPVQLGENNTVHAFVYTAQGAPLAVREWSISTVLVGQDVAPVSTLMLGILPHHAVGALTFPLPGIYEVRFSVRTTEIDQATVRTTVTVR